MDAIKFVVDFGRGLQASGQLDDSHRVLSLQVRPSGAGSVGELRPVAQERTIYLDIDSSLVAEIGHGANYRLIRIERERRNGRTYLSVLIPGNSRVLARYQLGTVSKTLRPGQQCPFYAGELNQLTLNLFDAQSSSLTPLMAICLDGHLDGIPTHPDRLNDLAKHQALQLRTAWLGLPNELDPDGFKKLPAPQKMYLVTALVINRTNVLDSDLASEVKKLVIVSKETQINYAWRKLFNELAANPKIKELWWSSGELSKEGLQVFSADADGGFPRVTGYIVRSYFGRLIAWGVITHRDLQLAEQSYFNPPGASTR